jgi:ferritin-like metal-binding protein YciE
MDDLTKERKKLLTEFHDNFVIHYNDYVQDLYHLIENASSSREDANELYAKIQTHLDSINHHVQQLDAVIDRLGWWHRIYRTSKRIASEAATRFLGTN